MGWSKSVAASWEPVNLRRVMRDQVAKVGFLACRRQRQQRFAVLASFRSDSRNFSSNRRRPFPANFQFRHFLWPSMADMQRGRTGQEQSKPSAQLKPNQMGTDRTPLSTPSSAAPSSGLKGGQAVPPGGSAWGSPDPPAAAGITTTGVASTAASPPAAATNSNGSGGSAAAAPVPYAWGKVGAGAAPPANGGGGSTPPPPAYASPDTIASAVHLARVSPSPSPS